MEKMKKIRVTRHQICNLARDSLWNNNTPRCVFLYRTEPAGPKKKKEIKVGYIDGPYSALQENGPEPGSYSSPGARRAATARPPPAMVRCQSPIKLRMCRDYGRRPASRIKPDNPRRRSKAASDVTLLHCPSLSSINKN